MNVVKSTRVKHMQKRVSCYRKPIGNLNKEEWDRIRQRHVASRQVQGNTAGLWAACMMRIWKRDTKVKGQNVHASGWPLERASEQAGLFGPECGNVKAARVRDDATSM